MHNFSWMRVLNLIIPQKTKLLRFLISFPSMLCRRCLTFLKKFTLSKTVLVWNFLMVYACIRYWINISIVYFNFQFDMKSFQSCRFELSKFAGAGCGKNTDYGFSEGKPCVILTLNRLIGWMPIDYARDSVPEVIKGRYKPNFVTLKCDGTVLFSVFIFYW